MTVPLTDHFFQKAKSITAQVSDDYCPSYIQTLYQCEDQLAAILHRIDNEYVNLDIGVGWIPLVLRLDRKLSLISPDYTISQVKEKFGGLRYYADFVSPPCLSSADSTTLHEIFLDLISTAERESSRTCDVCADYGEQVITPFRQYMTRCRAHTPA